MTRPSTIDTMFRRHVDAWIRHQDLKDSGDLRALYEARRCLDNARLASAAFREAM